MIESDRIVSIDEWKSNLPDPHRWIKPLTIYTPSTSLVNSLYEKIKNYTGDAPLDSYSTVLGGYGIGLGPAVILSNMHSIFANKNKIKSIFNIAIGALITYYAHDLLQNSNAHTDLSAKISQYEAGKINLETVELAQETANNVLLSATKLIALSTTQLFPLFLKYIKKAPIPAFCLCPVYVGG